MTGRVWVSGEETNQVKMTRKRRPKSRVKEILQKRRGETEGDGRIHKGEGVGS